MSEHNTAPQKDDVEEKPEVSSVKAEDIEHINLKVNYEGNEVFFKIKRGTPLKKLMDAFCKRQGVAPEQMRFVFDGNRLEGKETANTLGMEENDTIDVLVQQTGG